MTTNISYGPSQDAWQEFVPLLTNLINEKQMKRVCDIGGGANPVLSHDYIKEKGLDYTILDLSEHELNKAPGNYNKILANIASPDFSLDDKYDLMFSKMLAEHISDAKQFHKNVHSCLANNGLAVHFFPTLYTLPFTLNYLFPENLADILFNIFATRDRYQHEKFPAYYHWCRGPSRKQIQKYISLGYDVVEYRGFFGHSGYYRKIKVLNKIHEIKTKFLLRHPNPTFTSYAYVILKKK